MRRHLGYRHTIAAGIFGYISQSIVNNFAPLLFLTFSSSFGLTLTEISLLVSVNFCVQLLVDLLSAKFVDKIGYRVSIVGAHLFVVAGLVGLGTFPQLFGSAYAGLLCAITLYAVGGGLIEVLISPIVEACPTKNKLGSMSFLHSFYCWGSVLVAAVSTLYFNFAGIENWQILAYCWAAIPLLNAVYFCLVPLFPLIEEGETRMSLKKLLSAKFFWIFLIVMFSSGAAELAVGQWASAFAETGLGVSKTAGDLLGVCFFACMMGISRLLYAKFSAKINLLKCLFASGFLCMISYLLMIFLPLPLLSLIACGLCGFSVGMLWPGVYSLAASSLPKGGTAMFAFMALAGDAGCAAGPALVGLVSDAAGGTLRWGILAAIIFPVILIAGLLYYRKSLKAKPFSGISLHQK